MFSVHHTHLVARPLAEIFQKYDLKELHVSLTNGLWRYENWGYPVVDAAPGAELWAWFDSKHRTVKEIDDQWKELCGVLSGLFCASLSFIDHTNTVRPKYTFRPAFSTPRKVSLNDSTHQIRYATLPREIVCTENLTPWKKLLPVHPHEGLLSLLQSGFIHTTNYHSLGLHVRRLALNTKQSETSELMEIRQTVNLVFDKKIVSGGRDWSMRKMFGQGLNGASEMAASSTVYVDISDEKFRLTPHPTRVISSLRGGTTTHLAVYDVKAEFPHQMFSVAAVYDENDNSVPVFQSPPLYANRFLLGIGQERGKIVTKITNTHWTPLNVILQENLPWFVPVYLHTLRITIAGSGKDIKPIEITYVPGRLRERASHLEIAFKCPSRVAVDVSIDFDYVFLKWLEYPPDANHGHYIGSAVVMAQLPIARNFTAVPVDGHLFADSFNASRPAGYLVNIRTGALLITLPTPDFSMPYNVICLACTVVALAFGPIHNLSTKKLAFAKKEGKRVTVIQTIKKIWPFGKASEVADVDEQSKCTPNN